MRKYRTHLDSPANKALQFYLDDLIMPDITPEIEVKESSSNVRVPTLNKTSGNDTFKTASSRLDLDAHKAIPMQPESTIGFNEKLKNVEDLIEKANAISNLMVNQPTSLNAEKALELATGLLQEVELKEGSDAQDSSSISKENLENADNHTKRDIRDEQISLYESLPSRFQVLLCDIGKQTIAIPLVELGGIMQVERFTKRSSKKSWYYGLYVKGEQTFTCIDSHYYLASANGITKNPDKMMDEGDYKYLVQLGKSEFALCCRGVASTLEVEKQDVKWRESVTKQPWFAGILKDKMHALIDGAEMVRDVLKHSGAT